MLNINDLSQPDTPNKENYGEALNLAFEAFLRKDPGRIAEKANAQFLDRCVIVPSLDRRIVVDVDSRRISVMETGDPAPVWVGILVMHYLNNADGRQPTGNLKHFREFKEGSFYEPAFNSKTRDPLIGAFGNNPKAMIVAAEKLKGKIVETGDAAVELAYFPCLPITMIVWGGDEEFPAEASCLFDETADTFFSAEDMAVAGQMAVLELLKAAKG